MVQTPNTAATLQLFLKVIFHYLDDCSKRPFFELEELNLIVILNYSELGLHTGHIHESRKLKLLINIKHRIKTCILLPSKNRAKILSRVYHV